MKNLTLIVHANIEQTVADLLCQLPRVSGFTFTKVEGHGSREGMDVAVSVRDLVVGYAPHTRVDLILEDSDVAEVLLALRERDVGLKGRGVFWVAPVEYGKL